MRKNIRDRLSNPVLKLSELLVRIHDLWPWFELVKLSDGSKEVLFLHVMGFPLHKITLDLVGVLVTNFLLLPSPLEVSKDEAVLCLKAAKRLITLSEAGVQAFSRQIFQFCFQIHAWAKSSSTRMSLSLRDTVGISFLVWRKPRG